MKTYKIGIFGGTGFVGHALCALLRQQGHHVTIFSRRASTGVERLDVYNQTDVITALHGFDAVVNLIGILNEKGHRGEGFERAHVETTRNILAACKQNAIPRLIHMSALNADECHGKSFYAQSKGKAENLVHAAASDSFHVTSFRPSVIYGPGDSFLSKFAMLLKYSPGVMLLPSADAIMSPVYIHDVVQAMVASLDNSQTFGQRYDLCGPDAYTLKELVELVANVTHRRRIILGLNDKASCLVAHIMEYLPIKPYSVDNYLSALTPSVCAYPFPDIFKIKPVSIKHVSLDYLS